MDIKGKKRLLILITNNFAALNIIHCGLLKKVAGHYEVFIVSNIIQPEQLLEINAYFKIQVTLLAHSIPNESHLLRIIRKFQKAVFFHSFQIRTQHIKDRRNGILHFIIKKIILFLITIFFTNELLLRTLRRVIIALTSKWSTSEQLLTGNFDGVLSSSPLDIRENGIVNSLKAKQPIKSLAMVISWDNLSSKGIINADFDCILVWNTFMAKEYERFYDLYKIPDQRISMTGITRFDLYFTDLPDPFSSQKLRIKFRIPEGDKVIFYATSPYSHFPEQVDIVQHLLDYARQQRCVSILVRCHPADNYKRYQRFKNEEKVIIWHSQSTSAYERKAFSECMPELTTLHALAGMLRLSAVCINVASTIRLDAAACNKPVISIAYDGNQQKSRTESVARLYDYDHQLPLNTEKLDWMVFSKQQLFYTLDWILKNDDLPIDNHFKLRKFIHHTTPDSVDSACNALCEWLN